MLSVVVRRLHRAAPCKLRNGALAGLTLRGGARSADSCPRRHAVRYSQLQIGWRRGFQNFSRTLAQRAAVQAAGGGGGGRSAGRGSGQGGWQASARARYACVLVRARQAARSPCWARTSTQGTGRPRRASRDSQHAMAAWPTLRCSVPSYPRRWVWSAARHCRQRGRFLPAGRPRRTAPCPCAWRGGMPMAMSAQQRLDILVSFAKGFNAKQIREAMVLDARIIHGF